MEKSQIGFKKPKDTTEGTESPMSTLRFIKQRSTDAVKLIENCADKETDSDIAGFAILELLEIKRIVNQAILK